MMSLLDQRPAPGRRNLSVIFRSQAPKTHLAIRAVVRALLRRWPPLLLAAIAPLALTLTGQGRQAIWIASGNLAAGPLAVLCLWPILVGIYSSLLLSTACLHETSPGVAPYARAIAPQIAAIVAAFSLPLLLRDLTDTG
jgi:hypothetical protein